MLLSLFLGQLYSLRSKPNDILAEVTCARASACAKFPRLWRHTLTKKTKLKSESAADVITRLIWHQQTFTCQQWRIRTVKTCSQLQRHNPSSCTPTIWPPLHFRSHSNVTLAQCSNRVEHVRWIVINDVSIWRQRRAVLWYKRWSHRFVTDDVTLDFIRDGSSGRFECVSWNSSKRTFCDVTRSSYVISNIETACGKETTREISIILRWVWRHTLCQMWHTMWRITWSLWRFYGP